MFLILGMVAALGLGVYVGLGLPGMGGRQDRIVTEGRARRLERRHIHWLRPPERR
jgi:hypothetical protein